MGACPLFLVDLFLTPQVLLFDCNKGKVTFIVNDKEHKVYFPKKIDKRHGLNSIENIETVKIGDWDSPLHVHHKNKTIMVGTMSIKIKVS